MKILKELLRVNDRMVKVRRSQRRLLHHSNTCRVGQQHYHFTCPPFSLSCAPWVFTKVMKPLAILLWSMGVCIIFSFYYIKTKWCLSVRPSVRHAAYSVISACSTVNFVSVKSETSGISKFVFINS